MGGILVLDSEATGSDSDKSAQATRQNACRPKMSQPSDVWSKMLVEPGVPWADAFDSDEEGLSDDETPLLLVAEIPNNHLGCMKPYK